MGSLASLDPHRVAPPPNQDPTRNRIAQWLDQAVVGGILDLKYPTIPEAKPGFYTIGAKTDKGEEIQQSFELKEYGGFGLRPPASDHGCNPLSSAPVLPKYEVKVHLPHVITILDREATFRVCGK